MVTLVCYGFVILHSCARTARARLPLRRSGPARLGRHPGRVRRESENHPSTQGAVNVIRVRNSLASVQSAMQTAVLLPESP
jgi:hypothetical protein